MSYKKRMVVFLLTAQEEMNFIIRYVLMVFKHLMEVQITWNFIVNINLVVQQVYIHLLIMERFACSVHTG